MLHGVLGYLDTPAVGFFGPETGAGRRHWRMERKGRKARRPWKQQQETKEEAVPRPG